MRNRITVSLMAALVSVALAGCGSADPDDSDASPSDATSRSADVAEPTEVSDDAIVTEEPAEPEAAPLPDGPAAVGQVVTNGHLTVVIPDGYSEVKSYDGGLQFDGAAIPESAKPGGIDLGLISNVGMFPVGTSWLEGFFKAGDANVTQTVYSLTIPGADSATFEFLSLDQGFETELINGGGTSWTGPQGKGLVWVVAKGEVSGVVVSTHPGQAGLDFAMSIARTVSVA